MGKVKELFYRNTLLTLLGTTRAVSKADFQPPTKWVSFLDSLRASSDILYFKLSVIDEDLGEEFIEKEEIIEKRLGKEKFYSTEELEDLEDRKDEIKI